MSKFEEAKFWITKWLLLVPDLTSTEAYRMLKNLKKINQVPRKKGERIPSKSRITSIIKEYNDEHNISMKEQQTYKPLSTRNQRILEILRRNYMLDTIAESRFSYPNKRTYEYLIGRILDTYHHPLLLREQFEFDRIIHYLTKDDDEHFNEKRVAEKPSPDYLKHIDNGIAKANEKLANEKLANEKLHRSKIKEFLFTEIENKKDK